MANLSKEGNIQHKLGFAGLLITLGIVFGDIGTSPLYVMKAIIHTGEALDENYVLGALSCIIWTLTLQTTVKYVLVALRADNNGEGGILALYALLRRHRRRWIYIIAIIGASTLLADGIITPAITVTTAIEGLESISPHLPVIPITLTIITIIFYECPHVPKLAKFKPPRCPIGVYWNTLCLMRDVWTIKTYMI